ncbi:MAG: hypothetical protein ACTIIH_13710 [Brevibacterium sp.]|uniref:hypothetical protein n=1 Tax=Brevibacterium TaxID=1696 RepID=UPI003F89AFAA
MPNSAKNKGDRGEREVLERILTDLGDFTVLGAARGKNAGQPHDRGDLFVFDDEAVQVKNFKRSQLGQAVRESASGAAAQAANGFKPFGVRLSLIDGARKNDVRILASYTPGLADRLGIEAVVEFGTISKLRDWITTDIAPKGFLAYPRHQRWALLSSQPSVVVGTFEAFAALCATRRRAAAAVAA